jgi:hypothetical protein
MGEPVVNLELGRVSGCPTWTEDEEVGPASRQFVPFTVQRPRTVKFCSSVLNDLNRYLASCQLASTQTRVEGALAPYRSGNQGQSPLRLRMFFELACTIVRYLKNESHGFHIIGDAPMY